MSLSVPCLFVVFCEVDMWSPVQMCLMVDVQVFFMYKDSWPMIAFFAA